MNWLAAKIYDPFMEGLEEACLRQWRGELLSEAVGRVLEVGAGTGANVPFYPETVEEVVLTEPHGVLREKLKGKVPEGGPFVVSEERIETLAMEEGSVDTVVLTLVLCSVADPAGALGRLFRVLKPGGRLIFLEHVASERPGRHRVQRWVEPVWKVCAGNCHLTRQSEERIGEAGFEMEWIKRESMRKALPFIRPSIRGIARRPGSVSENNQKSS